MKASVGFWHKELNKYIWARMEKEKKDRKGEEAGVTGVLLRHGPSLELKGTELGKIYWVLASPSSLSLPKPWYREGQMSIFSLDIQKGPQ